MAVAEKEERQIATRAERRRSARKPQVRTVELAWSTASGSYVRKPAATEDICDHGACLRMEQPLNLREVIELTCGRATNWTLARVMRCERMPEGGTRVAVELAVPSRSFWQA